MFKQRCFLVYALAPESMPASKANDALNAYVEDRSRGVVVFHDHFVNPPHGGVVVVDVRSEAELATLDHAGPLVDWRVQTHPLTFSLSAVGFAEQTDLTLREYAGTSLASLREVEADDPRFWWQRGQHEDRSETAT